MQIPIQCTCKQLIPQQFSGKKKRLPYAALLEIPLFLAFCRVQLRYIVSITQLPHHKGFRHMAQASRQLDLQYI